MISVEVLTPEEVVSQSEVTEVVIPTANGVIGVRKGHITLVSPLVAGEVVLKGAEQSVILVTGGFVEVTATRVRILADSAVRSEALIEAAITEAIALAEKRKAEAESAEDIEDATVLLQRNLSLLKVMGHASHRNMNARSKPKSR